MHEIAVPVAQQLDLDVARPLHQLLEIDLVLAERGLGLAPGAQVTASIRPFSSVDRAHAAPAPAPGCLEHHRIADLGRQPAYLGLDRPGSGSVAGITGAPTDTARLRAETLLPSVRMVCGVGPMKVMPAAAHASANSGLSERKP